MIHCLVTTNDVQTEEPVITPFVSSEDNADIMCEALKRNGFIIMIDTSLYKSRVR